MTSNSTLCQGLQSCLKHQLLEPNVLLMNKLAPPIANISHSMTCLQKSSIPPQVSEFANSWSFLQILNNPSPYQNKEEEVYVHPSTKLSSSMMSTRSLEMCTESLGNESGSYVSENMDEFSASFISLGVQRSKCREFKKRIKRTIITFPPPLTTRSGMDNVQVRAYRESGRLVLRAVRISSYSSYFKAERANGRLRLTWLKDDIEDVNNVEPENGEETETKFNENENGISRRLGGEIGEYQRLRRCKESGIIRRKGIPQWGQFWVAIS